MLADCHVCHVSRWFVDSNDTYCVQLVVCTDLSDCYRCMLLKYVIH